MHIDIHTLIELLQEAAQKLGDRPVPVIVRALGERLTLDRVRVETEIPTVIIEAR